MSESIEFALFELFELWCSIYFVPRSEDQGKDVNVGDGNVEDDIMSVNSFTASASESSGSTSFIAVMYTSPFF